MLTSTECYLLHGRLTRFHRDVMIPEIIRVQGNPMDFPLRSQEALRQFGRACDALLTAPDGEHRELFSQAITQLDVLHVSMMTTGMQLFEVSDPRVNSIVHPLAQIMTPLHKAFLLPLEKRQNHEEALP